MSDDQPQDEHRRHPRVSHSFLARYRIPTAGRGVWLSSPLKDLSSGGARFLSERPFEAGWDLEMQLLLPMSQQPVFLRARVAWAKPAPLGMTELGVTFDPGDAGIQRTIDESVAHFLRKQGRA